MSTLDGSIKDDCGKPRLDLVPPAIISAIGAVRTHGVLKYGDSESWKQVEKQRYIAAFMRHLVPWLRDQKALDADSGLPHSWHMACNLAFLLEMEDVRS